MITFEEDIPLPASRNQGAPGADEIGQAIIALKEGQSFFAPAAVGNCTASVLQRRINVRSVKLRQAGRIDFFLITTQTSKEVDGKMVDGVRVWRRPTEVD